VARTGHEGGVNVGMRTFDTGAVRDDDHDKPDPEGFLSVPALRRYIAYMHEHRRMPDGSIRASDNWQKGIPLDAYMKSLWRHFLDVWAIHRGYQPQDHLEESLCGVIFNAMGYLHEVLRAKRAEPEQLSLFEDIKL
jgi:hypothetical protein